MGRALVAMKYDWLEILMEALTLIALTIIGLMAWNEYVNNL